MQLSPQTSRHATYVPTGRIWPSGDFSFGYRKIPGNERVDYRSHVAQIDGGSLACPVAPGWSIGPYGFPMVDDALLDRDVLSEGLSVVAEGELHRAMAGAAWADQLDLTTPPNSHSPGKRPEKYGKAGITGYGRKMVKSAATLIQKMPGKRITFATVTMPALPQHLRRDLALAWPELIRQLIQRLSRLLKSQGLPALICSVSEIQPGRLERYGEAYLHLHLVWLNHAAKHGNWAVDVAGLRAWVSEFLQKRGLWCDGAWVNIDTQRVKKTAAGYLAKYMSKGVDEIERFAADCGWDAVPGQWWNLSKPARDLVKKFTCSGDVVGRLLESIVHYALDCQELAQFHVLQPAVVSWDGCERIAGWFGVVTSEFRRDLLGMLASAS